MSDKDLEEKNSTEDQVEGQQTEEQVEAHASVEEVADTAPETSDVETSSEESAAEEQPEPIVAEETATEPVASEETEASSSEEASDNGQEEAANPGIISVEEFDWDSHENQQDDYNRADRTKLEGLYAKTLSNVEERQVVTGKVVNITDRDVVVNIGFKSDGMVPTSEFKYREDLKIGDEVDIMIEKREDHLGQIQLSHKKALSENSWDKIMNAHENDTILRGYIKDRTKGGMVVDLLTLDAFLPGSQIDIKPIKDYDAYVGTWMDLKVVKLNVQYRNIVVSHKAIIESDLEQQKLEILSKLEKGQVLEGVVKNLTSFGVFVDLGGVDGLIHITDVSWGRINHPEEILELGDKIQTVVLDYDEDKKRISLGMKQLTQHPWETLPAEIVEGSKVKGKVVNIEDYGAFVEIYTGVEGLVHVSEMSWSTHLKSPQEYVKLGDEVETVVLSIDREERKLALGMKQLSNDPWAVVEEKYPVNSKHEASVRSMTNFGLFMELEEGIDGLVHISDLSWTKKFGHPAEFTKVGERLEVVVLEIDKENRRLSLGHKQLEEDPWDTFETIFLMNSVHEGNVERVEDKGAIVSLPYGLEAFAPVKHLAKKEKGSKVTEGEKIEFKVIEFDRDNRKIILSHTQVWKDAERAQKFADNAKAAEEDAKTTKAVKKLQGDVQSDTLADANQILAGLKKDMEKEEKKKQQIAIKEMEKKMQSKSEAAEEEKTEEAAPEAKAETPAEEAAPVAETPKEEATPAEEPAKEEEAAAETATEEAPVAEAESSDSEEAADTTAEASGDEAEATEEADKK